jgi:tRNA pseudouridine(55) synthase
MARNKKLKKIILINKPIALTPLEAINKFKQQNPEYKNSKIAYAGRLDPMAQGLLLLVIDKENKNITKHMKHKKQYQAQILLGIQTDTYDLLGLSKLSKQSLLIKQEIKQQLKQIKNTTSQTLPPYSSYKIKGKPLFWYARNNQLPKNLPTNKIKITKLKLNSITNITNKQLLKQIQQKISRLNPNANFRQSKIIKAWEKLLTNPKTPKKFQFLNLTIDCSAGTYIRAIANQLNGLLLNLKRTKIGKYKLKSK